MLVKNAVGLKNSAAQECIRIRHTKNRENMSGENLYGRVGAMVGLSLGLGIMLMVRGAWSLDPMIQGAVFGASGAVAGGIFGEKLYAMKQNGS